MLEKCIKELGYSEDKKNSYYLADSKGIPIWKSDSICIDDKTDGEKNIPWTLMNIAMYTMHPRPNSIVLPRVSTD